MNGLKRVLNKESSLIYKAILKYGYSNFSLDIIEYCSSDVVIIREQYYIDLLSPEYNILKTAGSRLGKKHNLETKKAISITSRGRKILNNKNFKINNNNFSSKFVTYNTKIKLSLRSQGIKVKIFDKSNNFISEFPNIKSAAKYLGVHYNTISKIFNTGISYDEFIYKFEIKDIRILIYDCNRKLIEILKNAKETSKVYNIPRSTLSSYIKSGKLYKNKFFFRLNSEKKLLLYY